jgi:hypothetical protein
MEEVCVQLSMDLDEAGRFVRANSRRKRYRNRDRDQILTIPPLPHQPSITAERPINQLPFCISHFVFFLFLNFEF